MGSTYQTATTPGRHCAPSRTPGDSLKPVGGQEQGFVLYTEVWHGKLFQERLAAPDQLPGQPPVARWVGG